MELSPTVKRNLAVVASVTGILALAGCGGTNEIHRGPRKEGEWSHNSFIYPTQGSSNRVKAQCVGTALDVKTVLSGGSPDGHRVWLNDPACTDKVLTPSDNIASAIVEAAGLN